jgi:hypothetical protein
MICFCRTYGNTYEPVCIICVTHIQANRSIYTYYSLCTSILMLIFYNLPLFTVCFEYWMPSPTWRKWKMHVLSFWNSRMVLLANPSPSLLPANCQWDVFSWEDALFQEERRGEPGTFPRDFQYPIIKERSTRQRRVAEERGLGTRDGRDSFISYYLSSSGSRLLLTASHIVKVNW